MSNRLRILALSVSAAIAASGAVAAPTYTADGDLIPPTDYREWVFMSAGLDMSYSESAMAMGHSMFDNVFVDPAAWQAFKQTGHWPDKAMFVLETRRAESHGSINKKGQFQTEDLMGAEAHVHDEARFKGGWGFFHFDGTRPAKLVPYQAECYSCHQAHGAVDTTFTQFYPTAKPIAVKAGTFKEQ
jgi:Cytochrome P460